jgi:hypothetical protein
MVIQTKEKHMSFTILNRSYHNRFYLCAHDFAPFPTVQPTARDKIIDDLGFRKKCATSRFVSDAKYARQKFFSKLCLNCGYMTSTNILADDLDK